MASPPFRFKRFLVDQKGAAHPIGTDSVLLGAWAAIIGATRVLDIGTGTGIVALMLAQRSEGEPKIHITGVELHEDSCKCAQRNFETSPWSSRLAAVCQPVQHFAQTSDDKYDLIVSNPPFFTETITSPNENRRLSRTAISLSPGELLEAVLRLLSPRGRFCTILPFTEGIRFCEWGAIKGIYCTRETRVFSRKGKSCERLLLQFETNPYPMQRSVLYIYENADECSAEFISLTKNFYLHF